ncbi:type VII secretion integral membrane protein EccD [Williamsia herbipolensis]|uniref:type VII secretion integral membrane protein EccD n=1 Tax=Williamsia herbipolensis TaxID=1603258 RepID=UPI000695C544|nr:type VII secretion integral membrane protein EccD [Williamsia herbipolensis]
MTTSTPGSAPAGGIIPAGSGGVLAGPRTSSSLSPSAAAGIARAVEPELCRVSVLSGRTQVDVALPADVPVASLLPELAGLLLRNQFGEPERVPDDLTVRWTLGKVGHDPLDDGLSLAESGVLDGDLLVLRSDSTTELATVYDDVIDAVAGITRREFHSWTPAAARWLGVIAFLVAATSASGLAIAATWSDHRYDVAAIGFVAFLLFAVAGLIAGNSSHPDRLVGAALTTGSCLAVFVGCFAVLPGDDNAANILLGAGVSTLVAIVAMRTTTGEPFTHLALATTSLLVTIGGLIAVLSGESARETAAIVTVIALMVALLAPRLTILLVRLPIPAVPAAGASLDAIDSPATANVNAGVAAIGAVALPEATALEVRAKAANAHMSGMMIGAGAVVVGAAVLGAVPHPDFSWQSTVLGLLVSMALVLRGRSHSDLVQATGLISLGGVGLLAVLGVQTVAGGEWTVWAIGLGMLVALAAFAFGVVTPSMEFSPVLRRIGEFIEYLIIAVTVPLAAWVIGVYSLARGL